MRARFVFASLCLCWLAPAAAEPLSFGAGPDAQQIVQSALTLLQSNGDGERLLAGNAMAVNSAANRLYFVQYQAETQQFEIRARDYASNSVSVSLASTADYRLSHLEYDATPAPRLLAIGIRVSDELPVLLRFDLGSNSFGTVTELSGEFLSGISAFRDSDNRLFLIRRSGAGATLFSIDADSGVSEELAIPSQYAFAELVSHPSNGGLYALVDDDGAGTTFLASLGLGASLTVVVLGATDATCCLVLAGSAVIDATDNRLYAATRDRDLPTPAQAVVRSFSLIDGNRSEHSELSSNGLFADTGVVLGVLFADGFE